MFSMKKILILTLVVLVLASAVFAADDVRTGVAVGGGAAAVEKEQGNSSIGFQEQAIEGFVDKTVTTESFINRIQAKGNDVVHIIIAVGQWVCIAAFGICCIIALIGAVGNKRTMTGGAIGLVISGVAYALLTMAPEVVRGIAAWSVS